MRRRFSTRAPSAGKEPVQRRDRPGEQVRLVLLVLERRAEQFLEERRINLRAAVVVGADVAQVGAVGQGVLGDDIDIAAVEVLVLRRLAMVRGEALAEDHVGGAEAAGIGAAEEHRVLGHLRVERFAVGALEGRGEHVMAEPVAEPVVALLAVEPVGEAGVKRHGGEEAQRDEQRAALAIEHEREDERQRDGHQHQAGVDGQAVLIRGKGPGDPVRQLREADHAGGAEVMLAGRVPEAKEGQHDRDDAPRQAPEPELLVMGRHEGGGQGQAVADQAGDDRVGRAEEDLDEVGRGLVRAWD